MSESIGDFSDLLGGVGRIDPADVTDRDAARTRAQLELNRDRVMQAKIDRVLGSGEGLEVLAWLKSITIDRVVLPYELIGALSRDDRMSHADFREGENEVVRNIILAIQANRRGEDGHDEEET